MMVKRIRESPQTSSGNSGLGRPEGLDIQGHQTWASVFAPFKGHRKPSNLSRYSPPLGCLSHRIDPWGRTVFSPTFTIKINKINVGVYIYIYLHRCTSHTWILLWVFQDSRHFSLIFFWKTLQRISGIFTSLVATHWRCWGASRGPGRNLVSTPRWSTLSDLTKFVSPQHFQGKKN